MDLLGGYGSDDSSCSEESVVGSVSVEEEVFNEIEISKNEEKMIDNSSVQAEEETSVDSVPASGDMDSFLTDRSIPISHEVNLMHHTRTVTCLSLEPSGARLATGGNDGSLAFFDFGGMNSQHRPFRILEPSDGQAINFISHNPVGDTLVVGFATSSHFQVYDREAQLIARSIKGDMYLRDLAITKGHTMEVTCAAWHPSVKGSLITSGRDGTLRVWNTEQNGERLFGQYVNRAVLKARLPPPSSSKTARFATLENTGRLGLTSCVITPDGTRIFSGATDGTLQSWPYRERYLNNRPDIVLPCPTKILEFALHQHNNMLQLRQQAQLDGTSIATEAADAGIDVDEPLAIYSIAISTSDEKSFAVRYRCGAIAVWKLSSVMSTFGTPPSPHRIYLNQFNAYSAANVTFSPDGSLLLACSSPIKSNDPSDSLQTIGSTKSRLNFFDLSRNLPNPILSIALVTTHSGVLHSSSNSNSSSATNKQPTGIAIRWHSVLNQLFCTLSDGTTRLFYDPMISTKGALLSVRRQPKRERDPTDWGIVGEILTPLALPLFRGEPKKRILTEAKNSRIPERPTASRSLPLKQSGTSVIVSKLFADATQATPTDKFENPRDALLKYDQVTRQDPKFFGSAYEKTQPIRILAEKTYEEEYEEALKRQKL